MNNPIYSTGCTLDGSTIIGGVWTLWEQEGFPLEMSYLLCQSKGWSVDWLEALADASCTNNCPALMDYVESFLPLHVVVAIKIGFMRYLDTGKTYQQIVEGKRANGKAFAEFARAYAGRSNEPAK